jgi:hypothetical protein
MMLWLRDLGIKRQCFFNLAQAAAAGFTEHSGIGLWGAVLSARPDSIRIRPSGLTLRAINEMIQSQMIHVTTSGDAPVFEATGPFEEGIKKRKDPETITDIPIINAYAFRGETRKSILLFNLDVVGSREVETLFEGSVIGDSARFMQTIAAGIDANNEYRYLEDKERGPQVTLSDTILADFQSGRSFTLPPYSLTALSWKYQNGSHSKSKSFLPPRALRVKMNNGILHVMRGATDTDLDIKLYALNGRQVLRTVFPAAAGRSRTLDLRSENTEKGMYLLRVTQSSTNTVLFQTKISVIDR